MKQITNKEYEEYRYISYYFVCKSIGHGQMHLTEAEARRGLEPQWISLHDAVDTWRKAMSKYVGVLLLTLMLIFGAAAGGQRAGPVSLCAGGRKSGRHFPGDHLLPLRVGGPPVRGMLPGQGKRPERRFLPDPLMAAGHAVSGS